MIIFRDLGLLLHLFDGVHGIPADVADGDLAVLSVFPDLLSQILTALLCKDLAKDVKKKAEDSKVAIRNIRRDAMDSFKKQEKKSEITEDDLKNAEKDIQKLTDDFIKEIDKICDKKEKELTEI